MQPSFGISPFNIKNNVENSSYFTLEDVRKLFHEFAQDQHITIDDAVMEDILTGVCYSA